MTDETHGIEEVQLKTIKDSKQFLTLPIPTLPTFAIFKILQHRKCHSNICTP